MTIISKLSFSNRQLNHIDKLTQQIDNIDQYISYLKKNKKSIVRKNPRTYRFNILNSVYILTGLGRNKEALNLLKELYPNEAKDLTILLKQAELFLYFRDKKAIISLFNRSKEHVSKIGLGLQNFLELTALFFQASFFEGNFQEIINIYETYIKNILNKEQALTYRIRLEYYYYNAILSNSDLNGYLSNLEEKLSLNQQNNCINIIRKLQLNEEKNKTFDIAEKDLISDSTVDDNNSESQNLFEQFAQLMEGDHVPSFVIDKFSFLPINSQIRIIELFSAKGVFLYFTVLALFIKKALIENNVKLDQLVFKFTEFGLLENLLNDFTSEEKVLLINKIEHSTILTHLFKKYTSLIDEVKNRLDLNNLAIESLIMVSPNIISTNPKACVYFIANIANENFISTKKILQIIKTLYQPENERILTMIFDNCIFELKKINNELEKQQKYQNRENREKVNNNLIDNEIEEIVSSEEGSSDNDLFALYLKTLKDKKNRLEKIISYYDQLDYQEITALSKKVRFENTVEKEQKLINSKDILYIDLLKANFKKISLSCTNLINNLLIRYKFSTLVIEEEKLSIVQLVKEINELLDTLDHSKEAREKGRGILKNKLNDDSNFTNNSLNSLLETYIYLKIYQKSFLKEKLTTSKDIPYIGLLKANFKEILLSCSNLINSLLTTSKDILHIGLLKANFKEILLSCSNLINSLLMRYKISTTSTKKEKLLLVKEINKLFTKLDCSEEDREILKKQLYDDNNLAMCDLSFLLNTYICLKMYQESCLEAKKNQILQDEVILQNEASTMSTTTSNKEIEKKSYKINSTEKGCFGELNKYTSLLRNRKIFKKPRVKKLDNLKVAKERSLNKKLNNVTINPYKQYL